MNFIEICNNDLYAGLKELQCNPKYQCLILYNQKTYSRYSLCEKENIIYVYDNQGDSFSMDLNCFVKYVNDKLIEINVTKRI